LSVLWLPLVVGPGDLQLIVFGTKITPSVYFLFLLSAKNQIIPRLTGYVRLLFSVQISPWGHFLSTGQVFPLSLLFASETNGYLTARCVLSLFNRNRDSYFPPFPSFDFDRSSLEKLRASTCMRMGFLPFHRYRLLQFPKHPPPSSLE